MNWVKTTDSWQLRALYAEAVLKNEELELQMQCCTQILDLQTKACRHIADCALYIKNEIQDYELEELMGPCDYIEKTMAALCQCTQATAKAAGQMNNLSEAGQYFYEREVYQPNEELNIAEDDMPF